MRVVTIGEEKIEARGLKRKEIVGHLQPYGYTTILYRPVNGEDGLPDIEKLVEGREKILELVLGDEERDRIDEVAGNKGLQKIVEAVIKETYGDKEEEKNLSGSGNGAPTPTESAPAPDAEPSPNENE